MQISADFVTRFEKIFVSSESSSDKDANRYQKLFCGSSGSGDIRKKNKFQKQLDVFFVTYCTLIHCFIAPSYIIGLVLQHLFTLYPHLHFAIKIA